MIKAPRTVALYLRVSSGEQTVENQRRELRAHAKRAGWKIAAEYVDEGIRATKGRDKRPSFDRLLQDAACRKFDTIATVSVDRLGRSLQDLVAFLAQIKALDVGLYLHRQGLDTNTSSGRALFAMLAVFSEFEHALITERVKAGMIRAKAAGVRIGRPRLPAEVLRKVHAARRKGLSIRAAAAAAGVGVGPVQRLEARA